MHTRAAAPPLCLMVIAVLLAGCTSGGSAASSTTGSSVADTSGSGTRAPASSTAGDGSTLPAEVITPVLGSVPDAPIPVLGTDDRTYLAYELYLTNASSTPVTIDAVRVTDRNGGTVQELNGAGLLAHSRVIGAPTTGSAPTAVTLTGGQPAVVWLAPTVGSGQPVPDRLDQVVTMTFAEAPNPLIPADYVETIAPTTVGVVPAAIIGSPLDGTRWLNGNGCCDTVTPHRGALNPVNGAYHLAERFAIDWVQLTADDRIYTGDRTQLASYPFYGAPIHAVADGEIVAVSDDLPDEDPGANPPVGKLQITQFGGNYVVQRFSQQGHDYYAFYAHLKPGTARDAVTVGQQVTVGTKIGELGNSGNSDAPHLHFHVMDGPNPLASNGLPYVFESLTMVGRAADPDAVDAAATQGIPLALEPDGPSGPRMDAMPLWMDVVDLTAGH